MRNGEKHGIDAIWTSGDQQRDADGQPRWVRDELQTTLDELVALEHLKVTGQPDGHLDDEPVEGAPVYTISNAGKDYDTPERIEDAPI